MAQEMGGFDAQVASGKLREYAGCAPQGDTEVDTLPALVRPSSHRDIGGCPTQQAGPERRWDARGLSASLGSSRSAVERMATVSTLPRC